MFAIHVHFKPAIRSTSPATQLAHVSSELLQMLALHVANHFLLSLVHVLSFVLV